MVILNAKISSLISEKSLLIGFKSIIKFESYSNTYLGSNYYGVVELLSQPNPLDYCINDCLVDGNECIGVSLNKTHCFLYKDLVYSKARSDSFESYVLPHSVGFTVENFGLISHYLSISEKKLDSCLRKCLEQAAKCDYITYMQNANDFKCYFSSASNAEEAEHAGDNNLIHEHLYEDVNSKILVLDSKQKHYDLYEMMNTKYLDDTSQEDSDWTNMFYTHNAKQCWFHCEQDPAKKCAAASFLHTNFSSPTFRFEQHYNCFLFKKGFKEDSELEARKLDSNSRWTSFVNINGYERKINSQLSEHFKKTYLFYSSQRQGDVDENLPFMSLTECLNICTDTDNCHSVLYSQKICNLFKAVPDVPSLSNVNEHWSDSEILLINKNKGII